MRRRERLPAHDRVPHPDPLLFPRAWDSRNRTQPEIRIRGSRTALVVLLEVALAFSLGVLILGLIVWR